MSTVKPGLKNRRLQRNDVHKLFVILDNGVYWRAEYFRF